MMENYFYKLKSKFPQSESITNEINKGNWYSKFDFEMILLNYSFFSNLEIFKLLLKFKGVPNIIKMNPMSFYNWHTDPTRGCSINCLISGNNSKCFFGKYNSGYLFENLVELEYQPESLYLLNTKEHHSVLNLDNIRYVLSIGFVNNSYEEILTYCKEHNL